MSDIRHPTTRRGFIVGMGFGGVTLYGLWAAYGAAPGPLALLGLGGAHIEGGDHDQAGAAGHGGHGAAPDGPTSDDFRRMVAEFVDRYRMPDGSVYPRSVAPDLMPTMDHGAHGAAIHRADRSAGHVAADNRGDDGPVDVYLLAEKWFYEPAHLRLDAGVTYRFRMMAADVSHGASIQFGHGGRMIRLRPNTVAEMQAAFERPGSYLVYCTVYCGQAHDFMQARIEVV